MCYYTRYVMKMENNHALYGIIMTEPPHEKTNNLLLRKQRRRSVSR